MSALIAQVVTPTEGLESSLFLPLYLVAVLYVALFVTGRVLDGREDPRAATVEDAGFALLLLAAGYVVVLLVMSVFSQFDLIVDMLEIMAIIVAFFALLVGVLLALELLIGLTGRTRKRERAVPPPASSDQQ